VEDEKGSYNLLLMMRESFQN